MDMNFEKIGIFLAVVAVLYVGWRVFGPFVFSIAARAMGANTVVPLASADLRPGPEPVRTVLPAVAGGFDRRGIEAVGGSWDEAAKLNLMLSELQAQRQTAVARDGAVRARTAWKLAVFRQAALYRVVALAMSCAANWNSRQVLGAALCARALLEAAAVLQDIFRRLEALCAAGDLAGLDALAMARGFASPLDGLAGVGGGEAFDPALVDAVPAPDGVMAGWAARAHYDALSGLCEAGALGQYRVFGELDKAGTAVTFSADAGYERGVLGHVLGGVAALAAAEVALRAIDEMLPRVAALEGSAA